MVVEGTDCKSAPSGLFMARFFRIGLFSFIIQTKLSNNQLVLVRYVDVNV